MIRIIKAIYLNLHGDCLDSFFLSACFFRFPAACWAKSLKCCFLSSHEKLIVGTHLVQFKCGG